jgi:phosphoribosylformylglycinamidine synthase PurS subunit
MKCFVKVMPREVILDTQGRVVEDHLRKKGFKLEHCRIGKLIELTVDVKTAGELQSEVQKMMDAGLYNPLIENFEVMHDRSSS